MTEEEPVVAEEPKAVPEIAPVTQPPQKPAATNGLAIASMVVGIIAFFSGFVPFWGLLTGIAAVVLGVLSLKKVTGKGMAIAGIVTGGVAALTSILFTLLFIIALTANSAVINQANDQAQKQSDENQQMINAKKDFNKGETAIFGTLQVNVTSVQRNYEPTTSFYRADDGKEYVVVNITVKNIGNDSEYISPYTFTLNDSGVATDSAFITVDPEFTSDSLSPGGSASGNIVYEVTKDASGLKLQYETSAVGSNYESKQLVYTLAI